MSTPEQHNDSLRRVSPNFITDVIGADLESGRVSRVVTRFPPEPNGYMHLGHAFASFLDFGSALDFGGKCHLRMDDTNPEAESMEFAQGLQNDLRWLGWHWGDDLYFASDYYETYYRTAEELIERGLAYVDSVPQEEMARLRGTVETPGVPSPFRDRTPAENLDLFRRMRAGEFAEGEHVLRARIDLASPNMKLRDPVLYRILYAEHYRTGNEWCIYPMYDFQHPLQDAIEGVTHSLCSLEYVDNRAIYDWLMEQLFAGQPRPHQYEFGRRSIEYTIVSKRKLRLLVEGGFVNGWDDPRMPTIAGQRRRGVTPQAILRFASQIGVSRTNRTVDLALLENAVRDDLNHKAPRVLAVTEPLRVVLTNLGEEQILRLPYWPHDVVRDSPDGLVALPNGKRVSPELAVREVPLTRELLIEKSDFALTPPPGFKRLTAGGKVRLRGAGVIRCDEVVREGGEVVELRCTLLPENEGARGVIQWVSATRGVPAEFRLYDRLFTVPEPEAGTRDGEPGAEERDEGAQGPDFLAFLNPQSLIVTRGAVEPSVALDPEDTRYQFERVGYFWRDPQDSTPEALVFNRVITLKDTWAREAPKVGNGERNTERRERRDKAPTSPQPREEVVLSPSQGVDFERFRAQGVGEAEARVLAREPRLAAYLEQAANLGEISTFASWVVNDLAHAIREDRNKVTPEELAALLALIGDGTISARIAKDVLIQAQESGEAPAEIVERLGLRVVSDAGALEAAIDGVLAQNPDKVAAYRGGRAGLLGFFTGQVMKATNGRADPKVLQALLTEKLLTEKLLTEKLGS